MQLFQKVIKKPHPIQSPIQITMEYPVIVDPLANMSPSGSNEFNLIRMVQDHAPARLEAIQKELEQMKVREAELTKEATIIQGLIGVVPPLPQRGK
jgi:hypothetical protein